MSQPWAVERAAPVVLAAGRGGSVRLVKAVDHVFDQLSDALRTLDRRADRRSHARELRADHAEHRPEQRVDLCLPQRVSGLALAREALPGHRP